MKNFSNLALSTEQKEQQLRHTLRESSPLIVAYSGGVDSTYLAYLAYQELNQNMLAVLAVSPSLATMDKTRALTYLQRYNIPYRVVNTQEILDDRYVKNDKNRCFYCKTALFQACHQVACELQWQYIAYGFNYDDANDFRPGQIAAEQQHILRPLYDCGMTKQDIRECSERHGLADFDRPSQPCLSSRLLYGTEVTTRNLHIVETLEQKLHALGFKHCRARYDGTTVRIEVPVNEMSHFMADENKNILLNEAQKLNVKFITLDLEGFQSGKLNRILSETYHD